MKGFIFLVFVAASSRTASASDQIDIDDHDEENLTYNDIKTAPGRQRSAITNPDLRWKLPVPYVLHKDLDLNAKGVILKAFDQFRLKTCIDFTLWDAQDDYIHVKKLGGCFSYVGQLRIWDDGQPLSIGQYCDKMYAVEHEFLHALGFYHEHARTDRNDFVRIVFENIIDGGERHFNIAEDTSTQGVPYDYMSVMHYGKNAFTNGNGSTIITIDPKFQDVIGQRQAMSPRDVEELNLLYKCNSSIAFKMFCDFSDEAMCQISRYSRGNTTWDRVTYAEGGPSSDHTSLPSVPAAEGVTPEPPSEGHFMHVSTAAGEAGDSAWLETPRVKPTRVGHLQCLQFYYFHNGSVDDQLNIWIREFTNAQDTRGSPRIMGQVTGPPTSHWRLHHVSLDPQREFQVEFEVQKGGGRSSGGISIDDINLSETQCPHVTIQIDDFDQVLATSEFNSYVYSPRHYATDGYAYRFAVQMKGNYFGLRVQLLSGQYDDTLTWPCLNRQVTLRAVDPVPQIQRHMTKQRSFTTDAGFNTENGTSVWDDPRKFEIVCVTHGGEKVYGGPMFGYPKFWRLSDLKSRNFLKGGSALFSFNFEDLTPLVNGSSLPNPRLAPVNVTFATGNPRQDSCMTRTPTTAHPTTRYRTPYATVHRTTDNRTPDATVHRNMDNSIFCFSPVMMSSPILILLTATLLWIA